MPYRANRGGHAPGHLRAAFEQWAESRQKDRETVWVEWWDEHRPLRWLLGQLWNCTDTACGVR